MRVLYLEHQSSFPYFFPHYQLDERSGKLSSLAKTLSREMGLS